ncbi:GNAT family N-acetyltransferase [Haploplasma modicum]|uniref:GNAT family N-acetyltransferase n=1 Tax=Haploplasma modicum TaxID=2150 RepID=UPI00068ED51B|nr:GNAT family N-acetyltransferase [Haploplasma modicum]
MINKTLIKYLEENIIPLYENLDLAHRSNHVFDVINYSLEIAKDYDVNYEMVYTVAVFHDVGLIKDRKTHHIVGAEMLMNDSFINSYFNEDEVKIMAHAVMDHRASSKNEPRSIYGKIIAEADRSNSMDDIIERSFLFGFSRGIISFEESFIRIYEHIIEKYGENGYMKVYLKTRRTSEMLDNLRKLVSDKASFKQYSYKLYKKLINQNLKIVKYHDKYIDEMYQLFRETILNVNSFDYNEEQINAWINNVELNKWKDRFNKNYTVIALIDNKVLGFADIDETNYFDHLYVKYDFINLNIGKRLADEIERKATGNITTNASITAKDFFTKRKYIVIKEQEVKISNVALVNYKMIKYQDK